MLIKTRFKDPRMKRLSLSGGKVFKCKYHGYQNYDRFNKANYTDEARIKTTIKANTI